jgi:uncharacterized membrane protein YeiH
MRSEAPGVLTGMRGGLLPEMALVAIVENMRQEIRPFCRVYERAVACETLAFVGKAVETIGGRLSAAERGLDDTSKELGVTKQRVRRTSPWGRGN